MSYPARMLGVSMATEHDGFDAYVVAVAEDGILLGAVFGKAVVEE